MTRQKALVNGPTSASRTKIGDTPIATAPTTSAAKGARTPPRAAAGSGFIGKGISVRGRWTKGPESGASSIVSPHPIGKQPAMDRTQRIAPEPDTAFCPVETVAGPLDAGVLLICDHASNALPPGYGTLGLEPEALDRHIAYDIGAADLTRALAQRLDAPAVLSTFSRLLIDPNRGADDPTLVMRFSDGAIVPGNARIEAAEIALPARALLGALSRDGRRDGRSDAGERRAAGARLDPLVHAGLARGREAVEDRGAVGPRRPHRRGRCSRRSHDEADLHAHGIGDNEPYDGGLIGDTIDAIATARGLANALIEVRQDLIADPAGVEAWADRLARLLKPILADREVRVPKAFGSRARPGETAPHEGSETR